MSKLLLYILCQLLAFTATSQYTMLNNWQFRQAGTSKWYPATIPGSIHTDLFQNNIISDPFYADNESKLEWIDHNDWEYKTSFTLTPTMLHKADVKINFQGLDTYADVYLNNKLAFRTDNMFQRWSPVLTKFIKPGKNELRIYFHSAKKWVDSIAKKQLPFVLPDNPRVHARKAQYQFGWDWGPKFISCGIWKPVELEIRKVNAVTKRGNGYGKSNDKPQRVKLVQQKDSIGTSFYFKKDGQPIYVKGANWIPANAFPASVTKDDYRTLLLMAKDAGMNMLRIWGGGIYEHDYFYELCDSLDIMVWQDFMFAGGMYPGNQPFFNNVSAEVREQIGRLTKYSCVVLWCGNNEIDEAWHHWGWQNQFNLHGKDSVNIWNDYVKLFRDSLKEWTRQSQWPAKRPYVSTSPQFGWGNPLSYKNGDSHYWGLWWGLEGWEKFKTHTGRFVSEWGMQAMPDYSTVEKYTPADQRYLYSPAVNAHQKANDGFKKLNHYVNQYFFDTTKLSKLSLEEYTYLTQCVQYYILKNSIATQLSKQPHNMGTLIWQLNDCWPVTSWSIIDFYKKPKAGFYAVKKGFQNMDTATDAIYPKDLQLKKATITIISIEKNSITISANENCKYVSIGLGDVDGYLTDNYFDLHANEQKTIIYNGSKDLRSLKNNIRLFSLADILLK